MAESDDSVWPTDGPSVGETAERPRPVVRADIERCIEISGDRNRLHNEEATRATQFGDIVVQGA